MIGITTYSNSRLDRALSIQCSAISTKGRFNVTVCKGAAELERTPVRLFCLGKLRGLQQCQGHSHISVLFWECLNLSA